MPSPVSHEPRKNRVQTEQHPSCPMQTSTSIHHVRPTQRNTIQIHHIPHPTSHTHVIHRTAPPHSTLKTKRPTNGRMTSNPKENTKTQHIHFVLVSVNSFDDTQKNERRAQTHRVMQRRQPRDRAHLRPDRSSLQSSNRSWKMDAALRSSLIRVRRRRRLWSNLKNSRTEKTEGGSTRWRGTRE